MSGETGERSENREPPANTRRVDASVSSLVLVTILDTFPTMTNNGFQE